MLQDKSSVKCGEDGFSFSFVNTGVRHGCVLASHLSSPVWIGYYGSAVDQTNCGSPSSNTRVTDFVFASDAGIIAQSLEVLVLVFEARHEVA